MKKMFCVSSFWSSLINCLHVADQERSMTFFVIQVEEDEEKDVVWFQFEFPSSPYF